MTSSDHGPDGPTPETELAPEPNVRVVGGQAGWTPAETPPPPIPVLTPEALVRAVGERFAPIGTEASPPEVLHASTTVAATHAPDELAAPPVAELSDPVLPPDTDLGTTVMPAPGARIVETHHKAERWAPIASAVIGTVVILGGLLLGAAAAYVYGDPAACLAYSRAHHGAGGFGCSAGTRKLAIILPMVGLPLMVVAWLGWMWVPERSGAFRLKQAAGLFGAFVVLVAVAVAAMGSAVR